MRNYPTNEHDYKQIKSLNVDDWQVDALKMNPKYPYWGPHEDYMADGSGWAKSDIYDTWKEFGPWELNDLNECVNFYFYLSREHHECDVCKGSGFNSETNEIADAFYDFEGTGKRWCSDITSDEVEALVRHGRLSEFIRGCYFDEKRQQWMMHKDVDILPRLKRVGFWSQAEIA